MASVPPSTVVSSRCSQPVGSARPITDPVGRPESSTFRCPAGQLASSPRRSPPSLLLWPVGRSHVLATGAPPGRGRAPRIGPLASALAPTFELLGFAQIPMWTGIAMLIAAGVAATARGASRRTARAGCPCICRAPSAWIVGMPLIGAVAEVDWRLTFLVLPLPAAVLAGVAAATRPRIGRYTAPVYHSQASSAAVMRAAGPPASWPPTPPGLEHSSSAARSSPRGTDSRRRGPGSCRPRRGRLSRREPVRSPERSRARAKGHARGSLAASAAVALTWAFTPSPVVTTLLFALAALVAATRTVAGTVYGFAIAGDLSREVGSIRAQRTRSATSSVHLSVELHSRSAASALSLAFGGLFLAATVPYLCLRASCRGARQGRRSPPKRCRPMGSARCEVRAPLSPEPRRTRPACPFVSPGTRLSARDVNATSRPSALIPGRSCRRSPRFR